VVQLYHAMWHTKRQIYYFFGKKGKFIKVLDSLFLIFLLIYIYLFLKEDLYFIIEN